MLKSLQIKNFKSFVDSSIIGLCPINLLAGANSSGKSSIIQSILLIKQTIQYGAENRPIALNGPILRLGSLFDARNSLSHARSFEIAFEFEVEVDDSYRSPSWKKKMSKSSKDTGAELKTFTITIEVGSGEENLFDSAPRRLGGDLLRTEIKYVVEDQEGRSKELTCEIRPNPDSQYAAVSVDNTEIQGLQNTYPAGRITDGYVEKFMPTFFLIDFNTTPKEIASVIDYLTGGNSFFHQTHPRQDEPAPNSVLKVIEQWAQTIEKPIGLAAPKMTYKEVKDIISELLPAEMSFFNSLGLSSRPTKTDQQKSSLREAIRETLTSEEPEKRQLEPIYIDHIHAIRRIVEAYFKEGVRYLGPLREPPKPVYQPEALESFTEVGYRGEHTASVIEINKQTMVFYIEPPDTAENANLRNQNSDTLIVALTAWLRYLGVAQDVQTTDAGVYGNRLQVTTESGGTLHDLTNVGVGVSQVLPILVSTLLAPTGSLLIFEQPELHLHPKVQSRLADFLVCAARLGKQILLETHSEYLIDRLRLRIAQDENGDTASLINILFLEQVGGITETQKISVSEFGVIQNWPSDFFDQAEKDSAAILTAARQKRKKRLESNRQ